MSKSFTPQNPARSSAAGCLDRRDAAAYLSISTRLLDKLAAERQIARIKIGRKTLFRVADLDRFVKSKIQRLES